MKSNLIIGAIILILVSGLGCKKDNPASLTNTPDNYMVGSWRISSFVDGNVNQTTHFSEYTFICDASGNMSICINGDTIYSNWQWGDDSHSMCNFDIMGCDNDSYLWDLNYSWNITCLLYTSPSPRDRTRSRMPSSA